MRLKRLFPTAALILGLVAGLAWCVGPCCGSMGSSAPPLSIGPVPCCGSGTPSGCNTTIQRAADLVAAPHAPSLPSVAILAHGVVTAAPSILRPAAVTVRPNLPRPDLARLDVPLLI
jgi:hypothetical protein